MRKEILLQGIIMNPINELNKCETIEDLCVMLNREIDNGDLTFKDLANLPKFGGLKPDSLDGIYSWSADSVLEFDNKLDYRFSVQPRMPCCGEAGFHCKCSDSNLLHSRRGDDIKINYLSTGILLAILALIAFLIVT